MSFRNQQKSLHFSIFKTVSQKDQTLEKNSQQFQPSSLSSSSSEMKMILFTPQLSADSTTTMTNSRVDSMLHRIVPGITFHRIVNTLSTDWVSQISVEFSHQHCVEQDEYGNNQCHYDWGETLRMNVTACNIMKPLGEYLVIDGVFKV